MKKTRKSPPGLQKRTAREGAILICPLLLGCLTFYLFPFVAVWRNSTMHGLGNSEQFVCLENYQNLLGNRVFLLAFGNTLRFLAIALPMVIVIAFVIALMLKQQVQKHQFLKSVLMLPYIMPVVGTMVLVQLLFAEDGVLNKALYTLGLPAADWLHSDVAFWVVLLLYLWKNTGYAVILLLSGLLTIDKELYAAAALDGANSWKQFRHITLPQMWYSVFFATVFSLINAFKCFREIFLIGGTHPHSSIYMLQHFINNAFQKLNTPKLSVASVLLFLILVILFILFYRFVRKKEAFRE